MSLKRLLILGSTGSIGQSTMEVIDAHPGDFLIRGLAAYANVELLVKQYHKYKPEYLLLIDESKADELKSRLSGEKVELLFGADELVKMTHLNDVDIIVNAVVGSAGLLASLETVKQGRTLAIANKESLVSGGPLFPSIIKETKAKILPIDSEHSAIWQALSGSKEKELSKIIITASGGPFRTLPADQFKNITKAQALNHPTWQMGAKITIDSATLANKGLEVMEALILFSQPVEKIEVVIHPQSIIHSMVEFVDSSVMAQLSMPDMKLPISYALYWPERVGSDFGKIDWSQMKDLTFEKPDYEKFKALKLAFDAARIGGSAPAIFNAANEYAVGAFLEDRLDFVDIPNIIDFCLEKIKVVSNPQLQDILSADKETRQVAQSFTRKVKC